MRACQTNPSYSSATVDILRRGEVVHLLGSLSCPSELMDISSVMSFRMILELFIN